MMQQKQQKFAQWQAWLAENKKLNDAILQRNNGQPINIDRVWEASRADLEERHDALLGIADGKLVRIVNQD